MAIIGNIGGGGGVSAPSNNFPQSGAQVVPVDKLWKIISYSDDTTIAGDKITQGAGIFNVNGSVPQQQVGTGSVFLDFSIPRDGNLNYATITGTNGFGGLNTVTLDLYDSGSVFIAQLAQCQVTNNVPGGSCTNNNTVDYDVQAGFFLRATISYTPLTSQGGDTGITFSTNLLSFSFGTGGAVAAAGQTVDGEAYYVEEYDL